MKNNQQIKLRIWGENSQKKLQKSLMTGVSMKKISLKIILSY